jgi:hypothetical protein
MSDPSEEKVDYLLSRGALSGSRREQILEEALRSARAQPAPARRRWWAWGGGLTLAAGAAAFLLWLRIPSQGDFREKGGASAAPTIDLLCLGASANACPSGSLVAFQVERGREGFLSAYADPVPTGERIWYLTNEPVRGPVVPKAARIGAEHRPGEYRVQVVLSRQALPRDRLVGPDVLAHARFDLRVIP